MRGAMINDRSSALALLATRRSAKPRELVTPGPSNAELDQILTIAARTPDHGKLTPWRFVVIAPERRGDFALMLRGALQAEDPGALPAKHDKADEFAHQAPVLVAVVSAAIEGHKIDRWEQELSAGAAAMNLLHGAHALGYVGAWVTGWMAYSPAVAASLCAPGERVAGFVFIGTPERAVEDRPRPELAEVVREWAPRSL